jgi:pimeloyl-ACP methyl ester carboxylesterase
MRPPQSRSRRAIGALFVLGALALAWGPTSRHVRAASLLLRIEGADGGTAGWLAQLGARPVRELEVTLPLADGAIPARRYVPAQGSPTARVLLVHGVHFRGMNEPRLVALAHSLAASGMEVLTPHLASLVDYRIDREAVRQIAGAAVWLGGAREPGGAPRPVGVIGISFAGGLGLMAAASAESQGAIGWVVAVGAHHDLVRVGRWYAGTPEPGPDGRPPAVEPHPYGPAVFIRVGLHRFFPAPDLAVAEKALRLVLHERARDARKLLPELTEQGQAQLRRILARQPHPELAQGLMDLVREEAEPLRAVSPRGRLDRLAVPVLLLHGTDDPVVPSMETRWLARDVPPPALQAVLITPALRHAEAREQPSLRDELQLVRFLARMLAVAEG